MEFLRYIGLFLIVFGLIVFGSRLLLSRRTKEELKKMTEESFRGQEPIPQYFTSSNRMLMAIIILLSLITILIFVFFSQER